MKYVETSIRDIESLNILFSTLIEQVYLKLNVINLKEIKPYKEDNIVVNIEKEKKCCIYL